jgi:hypothetical protein
LVAGSLLFGVMPLNSSLAQNSEEDCRRKYLDNMNPKDWDGYNDCLTKVIQCKDCDQRGATKELVPKSVPEKKR